MFANIVGRHVSTLSCIHEMIVVLTVIHHLQQIPMEPWKRIHKTLTGSFDFWSELNVTYVLHLTHVLSLPMSLYVFP